MSVDPTKKRKIVVVHGVQTGEDEDQNQHETIAELVTNRLGSTSLKFEAEMYRYENVNDAAQKKIRRLIKLIAKTPVGGKVADSTTLLAMWSSVYRTVQLPRKYEMA